MRIEPESPADDTSTAAAVTTPAQRPPTDFTATPAAGRERRSLFRAFWRWHFYATVLVVPVLLVLAVTGGIYLLRFQVAPAPPADARRAQSGGPTF